MEELKRAMCKIYLTDFITECVSVGLDESKDQPQKIKEIQSLSDKAIDKLESIINTKT